MDFIFLSAGKCLTTRSRLTEIASLVYSTSLFCCLINQSEFAVASVCRGEQNGVIIVGVHFLLSLSVFGVNTKRFKNSYFNRLVFKYNLAKL